VSVHRSGVFRPDPVTDGAVSDGSKFKTHDAIPNVDRPAGPSDTMWVRATDGPLNTLVASPNLGLLGFEALTVIELVIRPGWNVASASQTGREQ
jgi:hypothetical protein